MRSSRRTFLGLASSTLALLAIPAPALAADGTYDISYLWARDLDDILDYRWVIATTLGTDVARNLVVVRGGSGNWGLLLDRKGESHSAARRLAHEHHVELKRALGGHDVLATPLQERGYSPAYHVRYGVHETDEAARAVFDRVSEVLGRDVQAQLAVEKVRSRTWHVVYKRYGDRESTTKVARVHARYLQSHGIEADTVADRFRDERWTAKCVDGDSPPPAKSTASRSAGGVYPPHAEVADSRPSVPAQPRVDSPPMRPELPAAVRTPLRDAINAYIQKLRQTGKVERDETTSWFVHTLHDDRTWAAINAELQLQCASMFKPYVALAFLHRAHQGRLIYGKKSKAKLEAMIQFSSNDATNWAMQQIGGPRGVQRILESYDEVFRETTILEWIPKNGRTYKNRSSARDYVRFSRALWRGDLPYSAEIRRLMAMPGRDRLATGAPAIPATTKVMNKTGTTSRLCGDFGILVARGRDGAEIPYAVAGIIEKRHRARSFTRWTAQRARVIRGVSNIVYLELGKHYPLV